MELEAREASSDWLQAVREGEYGEAALLALESDLETIHEKALRVTKEEL